MCPTHWTSETEVLGRLAFGELIGEMQYQAGPALGELYHRHHAALGLPMPTPHSVAGLLVNEGIFGGSVGEPGQEVIEKLRRRFSDATNALDQCDRDYRLSSGGRPTLLVYRVVCTDEEALNWKVDNIGNLRVALNALVRVFRMGP
jgi:hypothetical protein